MEANPVVRAVRLAVGARDAVTLRRQFAELQETFLDEEDRETIESIRGLALDRLELRAQVDTLAHANSQLVRRAAHALRTPIATIGVAASALARPALPPATSERLIEHIDVAVAELRPLLDALLRLSEIETCSDGLAPEPVALGDLVQDLLEASASGSGSGSGAEVAVHDDGAVVVADPDVVAAVLAPVLAAARAAASSTVTVRIVTGSCGVRIEATSDGPHGQDPAEGLDLIAFGGPLFDGQTTAMGVELTVARRLAARSGGRLRARIDAVGDLSFTFWLPAGRPVVDGGA